MWSRVATAAAAAAARPSAAARAALTHSAASVRPGVARHAQITLRSSRTPLEDNNPWGPLPRYWRLFRTRVWPRLPKATLVGSTFLVTTLVQNTRVAYDPDLDELLENRCTSLMAPLAQTAFSEVAFLAANNLLRPHLGVNDIIQTVLVRNLVFPNDGYVVDRSLVAVAEFARIPSIRVDLRHRGALEGALNVLQLATDENALGVVQGALEAIIALTEPCDLDSLSEILTSDRVLAIMQLVAKLDHSDPNDFTISRQIARLLHNLSSAPSDRRTPFLEPFGQVLKALHEDVDDRHTQTFAQAALVNWAADEPSLSPRRVRQYFAVINSMPNALQAGAAGLAWGALRHAIKYRGGAVAPRSLAASAVRASLGAFALVFLHWNGHTAYMEEVLTLEDRSHILAANVGETVATIGLLGVVLRAAPFSLVPALAPEMFQSARSLGPQLIEMYKGFQSAINPSELYSVVKEAMPDTSVEPDDDDEDEG